MGGLGAALQGHFQDTERWGVIKEETQEGLGVACSVKVSRSSKDRSLSAFKKIFLEDPPSFARNPKAE